MIGTPYPPAPIRADNVAVPIPMITEVLMPARILGEAMGILI